MLLSKETELAYRTQLLTDLINETDPEKKEKMLEEINTKYAEIASIAEIADQKAIAASMIEYGNLDSDLVYELESFLPEVANDDPILKELNFLNSPKLGED